MLPPFFDKVAILFLVVINIQSSVFGEEIKEKSVDASSRSMPIWFGPRLGKRSLSLAPDSDKAFYRMLEAADVLKYYYDQLPYEMQADEPETRVTKKVIFTPKLGRSLASSEDYEKRGHDVDFTPRLGKRRDEMLVTPPDTDVYHYNQAESGFFSPRLGRSRNYSPRLGRDLSFDSYPPKIRVRVARSVNTTEAV